MKENFDDPFVVKTEDEAIKICDFMDFEINKYKFLSCASVLKELDKPIIEADKTAGWFLEDDPEFGYRKLDTGNYRIVFPYPIELYKKLSEYV